MTSREKAWTRKAGAEGGCTGKHKFQTPQLAQKAAARSGSAHYKCAFCGFFHVGKRHDPR